MKYLVVGTLRNCPLPRVEELKQRMWQVALLQQFSVRSEAWHQFEPHGATGMLLLSESHFCVHTWPETGEVFVDVFCCSQLFEPKKCIECIETVFGAQGNWETTIRS